MQHVSITKARRHWARLGRRVARYGHRVIVERRGRPVFAMVALEDVELLDRLEDRIDLEAVHAAKGKRSRPWTEVKKALGL